jgi:hypothetical protein
VFSLRNKRCPTRLELGGDMHPSPPCESRFGSSSAHDEAAKRRSGRTAHQRARRSPEPPRAPRRPRLDARPPPDASASAFALALPTESTGDCRGRAEHRDGERSVRRLWREVVASAAMPSLLHEGLLALIRDRPEFAAELLREVLHVNVPEFTRARITEAALNELVPTEYHADLVVLLEQDKPVFGIVHEAQLQPDERKRFTWPMYGTSLRARLECPVVVVVITVDNTTASWAAQPIPLGGQSTFVPLVIGPEGVPVITDPDLAAREPELAVLSVMAHGRDEESIAVAVARAAAIGHPRSVVGPGER